MDAKKYTKQATSVDQQISLLKQRGLIIQDKEKARHILSTVNLHRLSTYFYPHQQTKSQVFLAGTTLQTIWELYTFDRQLRLVVIDAIERIEVALRTSLTNTMAVNYSPLWYLDDELFKSNWLTSNRQDIKSPKESLLAEIKQICKNKRHNEEIRQYYSRYNEPKYPPSWIILEFLSFGKCTSLFRFIRSPQDKSEICEIFNFHYKIFESLLEPLRYTRNLCAHHSRLWDRWYVYKSRSIRELTEIKCNPGTFKALLAILHLLNQHISPYSHWMKRLYQLFERYDLPQIDFTLMGFQKNWKNDPFWNL